MNKNKIIFIVSSLIFNIIFIDINSWAQASNLRLEDCIAKATQNFPLAAETDLLEQTRVYTLDNVAKNKLPRLSLAGQATYQSDVTHLPISLPNVSIEQPSKDQYKLYGEVVQPLTEFKKIDKQKELENNKIDIQKQQNTVNLYEVRQRVAQLYFGMLLSDEQLVQLAISQKDIDAGMEKLGKAVGNGMATTKDLDLLKARRIELDQKAISIRAARTGMQMMLSQFINEPIDESTELEKPEISDEYNNVDINALQRPELDLFGLQKESLRVQGELLDMGYKPQVSLFAQGGLGRPGLNMLSNDLSPYFLGGVRLNWPLNALLTKKNDHELLAVKSDMLDVQKNTFLFNVNLQLKDKLMKISELEELIVADKDLLQLRGNIKTIAQVQLENGIITALDYVDYVNAEDAARQNMAFHGIKLLATYYDIKLLLNN
jgi:outer membrane protein TolC